MIFNVIFTNEDDDGAGSGKTIDENQANKIYDLLLACDMDGAKSRPFLQFIGVGSVDDIPVHKYEEALTQLHAKLKRMGR